MSSKDPAHPYTSFVIKWLDNIGYQQNVGDNGTALKAMIQLLNTVDPDKRDAEWKELNQEFYKAWNARRKVRDSDPILLKTKLNAFDYFNENDYMELWSRLWGVLWKNGYFYMNTFLGVIPTSTLRKESEPPEEEPLSERLSEAL